MGKKRKSMSMFSKSPCIYYHRYNTIFTSIDDAHIKIYTCRTRVLVLYTIKYDNNNNILGKYRACV